MPGRRARGKPRATRIPPVNDRSKALLCGRCGVPYQRAPNRVATIVSGTSLYLTVGLILGLPLAAPGRPLLWGLVGVGVTVAVGLLLSHLLRRPGRLRCPRCGRIP
jgi:hypothetical protein